MARQIHKTQQKTIIPEKMNENSPCPLPIHNSVQSQVKETNAEAVTGH